MRTNVRMAVLKRKEHDLETWMFLLDIAKACLFPPSCKLVAW